ncbi:MAG: hypothetical protein ABSD46_13555 [Bacteroidota bacterium]
MIKKIGFLVLSVIFVSCNPYAFRTSTPITHSYELTVSDIEGKPLEGASVQYTLKNRDAIVKDTIVVTPLSGKVTTSVQTTPDPQYYYVMSYRSEMIYRVKKEDYYSQNGSVTSVYDGGSNTSKPLETKTITLLKPTDYFQPTFLSSVRGQAIKVKILGFIDLLLLQSLLSDSYLETQTIDLVNFKEKDYLAFVFNNTDVYNSLKLNKYDIAKTLFDEVIRKMLNPLNDYLGDSQGLFGYDLTVWGHTKSFADKYASDNKIIYRFLIPSEIVKKYKLKDISGQQVLDASIILMDDERIDLKLQ